MAPVVTLRTSRGGARTPVLGNASHWVPTQDCAGRRITASPGPMVPLGSTSRRRSSLTRKTKHG